MYDDDEDEAPPPAVKFDPFTLVVIGVRLFSDIHDAFGLALSEAFNRTAMHANWRLDRRKFAAEVGREIEALSG